MGIAVAAVGSALLLSRRAPWVVAVAAMLGALGLGFASGALRWSEGAQLEAAVQRTRGCDFEARVLEQAGGLGTLAALEAATCTSGPMPPGNVFLDATPAPPVGAVVSGRGWLTTLGEDDFALARRRAGGRALLHPLSLEEAAPTGFWGAVARVRSGFSAAAQRGLPPREAALLLGLTVGDTSGFSVRDTETFRASGLAHLLAVSGSNVAIVLGAVAMLSRRAAYRHRLAFTLAAVVAFVAIVGPDGSVLRAAVMGTVAMLAGGWVRPVDPIHSLPFALLVLIATRPAMVTSAGLHLSAAATLGIVVWSQAICSRLSILPRPLAAPLGVTLAAQLGVAPLLILLFERVSLVAPASNVAAAPAVAVATLVGMVVAVLGPVAPGPASIVATAARPALSWILWVADESSSVSWAEVTVAPGWGWVLGAVVFVACVLTLRGRSPA